MTSKQLKELQDTLLPDNNQGEISPQDVRDVLTELIKKSGGWADYSNSAVDLQTISANTWTQLTNNGTGVLTKIDYKPYYTTSLFNNNAVNLKDIPEGTVITLRNDITLNITSNNTDVLFRVKFKNSDGTEVFTQLYDYRVFKNTGQLSGVNFFEFYVGADILNGSVELEVNGDHNFGAKWNGIFITIP
jgi:hypothetical protein